MAPFFPRVEQLQFFWEFSHLDKVCFEAYLQLLSIQYPAELHIIQVDNARLS
jgi:putative transposase